MKLLTKDNQLLYLYRIGESDTNGSGKLFCKTAAGDKVVITWSDVAMCFGSYTFSTLK